MIDDRNRSRAPVPVVLDGHTLYIEAVALGGEEEVAGRTLDLSAVIETLGAVAQRISEGLSQARPGRMSVEFGCELGLEQGGLTAIIVKGTAHANFNVVLEWSGTPT